MASPASAWTSLEVAKLAASLATPFAVVVLSFAIGFATRRIEAGIRSRDRLAEKRFDTYEKIGFGLNDIYAYFRFVGDWKRLSVDDVLTRKRELDRVVYTYCPLFTPEFLKSYHRFINEAFQTYQGWGKDAALRTTSLHRPEASSEVEGSFTEEDNLAAIRWAYEELLDGLARELGFTAGGSVKLSGQR